MNTNTITKEQFLTALFEGYLQESEGYLEIRDILNQNVVRREFYKTYDGVIKYVPEGDLYFGVCPREIKSGKEEDIKNIVSLYVDLDMAFDLALTKLTNFPLKPSIIVDSGHGAHVYWLLREPENIRANTKGVLKGLCGVLGADNCFDLSRVLRLPETKNVKYPDSPKDVKVTLFEPERRYNLSDFDSYEVEIQKKGENLVNFTNTQQVVDLESLKLSESVKNLIKVGKQEGDKYESRSEADYCVVCALARAGHSDDIIKAVFDVYPIGAKYTEKGEEYLKHIISRARQSVGTKKSEADIYDLFSDGSYRLNLKKVREEIMGRHRVIYSGANFYEYKDGCYREVNIEVVKQWVMALAGTGLSKRRAEEIIYFLQSAVFVDVQNLNQTEYLNVKNGLLDLKTGNLLEHTSSVYSTIQLDVTYNTDAKCDLWIKTLNEIFSDEGGEQKIKILQEFFGLCLTKETKYEKVLLCIGEGSNGKSVTLWVLQHLLKKENVSAIPLEKFDNHHYLINIFGKLANISIETNAKSEVYDSIFKAIVSGDLIQADQKFKPAVHFNPFCKLVFATNNLPRVDDKSDAFFRRLLIVRFNQQFSEIQQNKNLKYELLSELDGIFIWALRGLQRLQTKGHFETSDEMQREIEEYRLENNNIKLFVSEECDVSLDASVKVGDLFSTYANWCNQCGFWKPSIIKFGKELKRQFKGVRKVKTTDGVWVWCGIKPNFIAYRERL